MICNRRKCPACKSNQIHFYKKFKDQLYGLPGKWNVMKCNKCCHEFINPIPKDSELKFYYSTANYYSFNTSKSSKFISKLRRYTRRLLPSNLKNKNFLDYGCGEGEVLLIAKEKGANVFGIERQETINFVTSKTGLNVKSNFSSDWVAKMDYVRSFHSLEHIKNPSKTLNLFRKLCKKKGGKILIGVPNVDSLNAKIFGRYFFYRGIPLHIHGFTKKSISALAKQNNLNVVKLKTPSGFRGILSSILISIQSLYSEKTLEPSLKMLLFFIPLYLMLLPYTIVTRLIKKGDVIEVELTHTDD